MAKLAGKTNFREYGAARRGLADRDPDGSMCRGTAAMVITGKYWSIVLTLCGASVAAVAAQQALTEAPTGFDTRHSSRIRARAALATGSRNRPVTASPSISKFTIASRRRYRVWTGLQRAGLRRLSPKPGQRRCQPVH